MNVCRLPDEPVQMSSRTVYHVWMGLWWTSRLFRCRGRVFLW